MNDIYQTEYPKDILIEFYNINRKLNSEKWKLKTNIGWKYS